MKKQKNILLLLGIMLMLTSLASANSIIYKISATIPEIPGVNVPPFDDPELIQKHQEGIHFETVREEMVIGQQKIIRITTTEK